jgi:NADPH:quinone reductase-like Zn-dependent oxidoreductase
MKAVTFEDYGGPSQVVDVPVPELPPGHLLIKMAFAAINPRDLNLRAGMFRNIPPPLGASSKIVGNEGSGTVFASTDEQHTYPVGTHVFFREAYHLPNGGTWQEYVVAKPQDVLPVQAGKDMREAAALRTGYQSALMALEIVGFQASQGTDQLVLAPAVGSSVGNAAIQLARAYGAPEPITTAGSTAKAEKAHTLGYSKVIDLSQESLRDGVKRLTGGAGVDVALDILIGPYLSDTIAALKPGKTIVIMGGSAGVQVSFLLTELVGPVKNMRPLNVIFSPPQVRQSALERIVGLWEHNHIHPLVDRMFPISEAAEAQRYSKEGRPLGKVLLSFE